MSVVIAVVMVCSAMGCSLPMETWGRAQPNFQLLAVWATSRSHISALDGPRLAPRGCYGVSGHGLRGTSSTTPPPWHWTTWSGSMLSVTGCFPQEIYITCQRVMKSSETQFVLQLTSSCRDSTKGRIQKPSPATWWCQREKEAVETHAEIPASKLLQRQASMSSMLETSDAWQPDHQNGHSEVCALQQRRRVMRSREDS
eukprot:749212-Hanusia_phi.AAC.1